MDVTAEIRKLEESHLVSEVRGSAARLGALLAEDFVEFGSSGRVWQRAEIIDDVVSEEEEPGVARFISDFIAKRLAENVVLTTYRCTRRSPSGEVRVSLRSSVWRKSGEGSWQMCFHQGTMAAPPVDPDLA
ncbi:DUF4440 domain-containing protein [Sulfidibacter corallicola]|uniref:DUF4440 domain-containing protein n=1 Tax=Sulfidibacter corallicola TaxID=2818388 RepID=A0A8A4TKP4_SULCO|nr:DUF4440 domain-containing protein [Sulfidibacter corallicola]QTD49774.1 DUF4440 domain-containing protein [Sulfidibacter corallicola]